VWPSRVVVLDVATLHVLQLAMREDQQVIEAVSSDRLCPALGEGVGTGSPNRRAIDLDPFGPENLAEWSCESGVTVPHQEADGALRLLQIPDQDPLNLSDPLVLRDRGDAEEVDDPALDLDDERGVGAQEPRPGWSLPAGSWRKPVVAKHVSHGRGRHRHAELAQLAHDPEVAPPGALPRQSTDQLDVLTGERGTARLSVWIASSPLDDLVLPGEEHRRRHQ